VGSLRAFHLFFILLVILSADLFGIWAIWHYVNHHDLLILVLGILSLIGGFGLIWYAIRFVQKFKDIDAQ